MKRSSLSGRIFDIFNILFLGLLALIMFYPYWNVFMTSFSNADEYYHTVILLLLKKINLEAYKFIFSTSAIPNALGITVIATVCGTAYSLFLIVTAAYGLSKKELPGRNFILKYFLVTMYFSGGVVPYYIILTKYLHYTDKVWANFLTNGLSVGLFIILKNFFNEIPESVPESAKIDGANEFVILFRIILPLSLPSVATIALFLAVGFWNTWYDAILFINKQSLKPMQLILREMMSIGSTSGNIQSSTYQNMLTEYQIRTGDNSPNVFESGIKMATLIVATLPIICVYPFLLKYFTKGVMVGSIKA